MATIPSQEVNYVNMELQGNTDNGYCPKHDGNVNEIYLLSFLG